MSLRRLEDGVHTHTMDHRPGLGFMMRGRSRDVHLPVGGFKSPLLQNL